MKKVMTKIDMIKCFFGFHNYPKKKKAKWWDWRFCKRCGKSQWLIKTYNWGPDNSMTGKVSRMEWRTINYNEVKK